MVLPKQIVPQQQSSTHSSTTATVFTSSASSNRNITSTTTATTTAANNTQEKQVDEIAETVYENFVSFLESFSLQSSSPSSNNNNNNSHNKRKINNNNNNDQDEEEEEDDDQGDGDDDYDMEFGLNHNNNNNAMGSSYYQEKIKNMLKEDGSSLNVDFLHIIKYAKSLAKAIQEQYHRLEQSLRRALLVVARKVMPEYFLDKNSQKKQSERPYFVCFYNVSEELKIRDLRSSKIGRLCTIIGTVTRTSEIRPELLIGAFRCMDCSNNSPKVFQQFKYTEPSKCLNPLCQNSRRWEISLDESIFVDWQKVRIQENSGEIPSGSMPRSIDIILRGDAVEVARAGDRCQFTGTLMVIPDVSRMNIGQSASIIKGVPNSTGEGSGKDDFGGVGGLKDLGVREMNYKLCFFASTVRSIESKSALTGTTSAPNDQAINIKASTEDIEDEEEIDSPDTFLNLLTDKEREAVLAISNTKKLYRTLVNSIAPSIFGHEEIKRGVLLMMFGGVHKRTPEKIRLRGDINVCIVGDPSTSKSQFLKYLVSFMPRTVYTSGKASSAAGLTATVVKDPDTGDFNIEAGALMLADNGICCIDEFDKMDPADQVAIHEAMEQQTISIAKAGIHATLNARASILAAANPIGGRYDRSKSLKANLNIGSPLMSRFDLFFVVLDECDKELDRKIAKHIVSVHQKKEKSLTTQFEPKDIQNYIKYARLFKPVISEESASLFEKYYSTLRQNDTSYGGKTAYRITVRQLESMVRLSEALARLHLDEHVRPRYVEEAFRLLRKSIIHVQTDDLELSDNEEPTTNTTDQNNNNNNNNTKRKRRDNDDDEPVSMSQDTTQTNTDNKNGNRKKKTLKQKHQSSSTSSSSNKQKVVITSDKYFQIYKLFQLHIGRNANRMKIIELLDWYIDDQLQTNVITQGEVEKEKHLARLIANKMINEGALIVVKDGDDPDERVVEVHSNVSI